MTSSSTQLNSTQLNGVIGYPLGQSLGPAFHPRLYALLGLHAEYRAYPSPDCAELVTMIRTLPLHLVAVTIPHKEAVMQYLDEIDAAARAIGAVNTIINRDGRLCGYNTDVVGASRALSGVVVEGKRVLILGAGGASRAVASVLHSRHAHITYASRTQGRAETLALTFPGAIVSVDEARRIDWDVIINTTPVGMTPNQDATPFEDYPFHPDQTVFDVVYCPRVTRLLRESEQQGARAVSGFDMYLFQALEQIRLWSGIAPPEKEARQILDSLLPS